MTTGVDWASIEQQAIQEAMPYFMALIGLAGSILIALGTIVLNRFRAKLAADEAVSKDALNQSITKQAVFAAEEVSAVHEKQGHGPDSGVQKEVTATAYKQAIQPDKTPAEIRFDIKATLGATPGVGASITPVEGKA